MSDRPTMLIAGATGVVGSHLVTAAKSRYRIRILTRGRSRSIPTGADDTVVWAPREAARGHERSLEEITQALDGVAVVVNLAGASLAEGRLDERHRRRVLQSRLDATNALVAACRRAGSPPPVWLQASAVGYYGDTGEQEVTEATPADPQSALGDICQQWEAAAVRATEDSRIRQIVTRIGLVLAPDAPAWRKMLLPIKLGVGGALGSGRQWWPWIDADDVAGAMLHLIELPDARGAYNLVAPEPVRQLDLVKLTARALGRPALLPTPAFALRLALGEVADALLLPSCRARPGRLLATGYRFGVATVEEEVRRLTQVVPGFPFENHFH